MATLLQEFLQKEAWQNASLAAASRSFSWRKCTQQQKSSSDGSDRSSSITSHPISSSTALRSSRISYQSGNTTNRTVTYHASMHAAGTFINRKDEVLGAAVASDVNRASTSVSQGCMHNLHSTFPSPSSSTSPVASCSLSNSSLSSPCPSSSVSSCLSSSSRVSPSVRLSSGESATSSSAKTTWRQQQQRSGIPQRAAGARGSSPGVGFHYDQDQPSSNSSSNSSSSNSRSSSNVSLRKKGSGKVVGMNSAEVWPRRGYSEKRDGQEVKLLKEEQMESVLSSSRLSFSISSFVPCAAAASLPVLRYASAIVEAVQQHQVTIIVGETGSGKTTQIPQLLHAAGFAAAGIIGITQPRRVAAVSLAARVAEEMLTRRKEQQQREQQRREQQQQQQQLDWKQQDWKQRDWKQQQREEQEEAKGEAAAEEKVQTAEKKRGDNQVYQDERGASKRRNLAARYYREEAQQQQCQKEVEELQNEREEEFGGRDDAWRKRMLLQSACSCSAVMRKKRVISAAGHAAQGIKREDCVSSSAAASRSEVRGTGGDKRDVTDDRNLFSRETPADTRSVGSRNHGHESWTRAAGGGISTSSFCCMQQDKKAATATAAGKKREESLLGRVVGYAVRFEDVSSSETRIKFMTDGLLLREAIRDPSLLQYSLLIIDEAHERSLRSDVLLGYLKLLLQQQRSKSLRVLVMSATLETKKFLSYFPQGKLLVVPGRSFPLEILHAAEPQEDYVEAALVAAMQIHLSAGPGDILVFLPGQEDIEALGELLLEKRRLLRAAAAVAVNRTAALLRGTIDGSSRADSSPTDSSHSDSSRACVTPAAAAGLPRAALPSGTEACSFSASVSSSSSPAATASYYASLPLKMDAAGAMHAAQQPVRLCISIGDHQYTQQLPLRDLVVCPLYAALPFDQQKAVFDPAPPGSRKIILATNVAETSITVQGIRYVIDSGLMKRKVVHHRSGIEALVVREISKESAAQRAGRAARETTGVVYRLYTEETFEKFKTHRQPEILSSDLGQIFLELKALRIANPLEFPFLDPPSAEAFFNAGRTLHRIGALDAKGDLTSVGRQLSALPLSPLLGKLLLESLRLECAAEILIIVAMLSTDSLWNNSRRSSGPKSPRLSDSRRQIIIEQSDHLTLLNAYKKWDEASDKYSFCREYGLHPNAMRRAAQIRQQLEELLKSSHVGAKKINEGGSHDNWASVRQCLAAGCWLNTARLQRDGSSYVTTVQRLVARLHPSSVLFGKTPLPGYIVYSEYVQTTKPYLRCVTAIEGSWLQQLVPRWFSAVENAV